MKRHQEHHQNGSNGWLRAAVLGANDGIISTASLMLGVAAAHASRHSLLVTGLAGLVAGAMSMATGEYVSVSSQADTEQATLAQEQAEIDAQPTAECRELAGIYRRRGLDPALASTVAAKLMAHDALDAHAREELGISEATRNRPLQAAAASAASFAFGAALPLAVAYFSPPGMEMWLIGGAVLFSLAVLGALAAKVGGAPLLPGTLRVTFWGALAMGVTAGIGALTGTG